MDLKNSALLCIYLEYLTARIVNPGINRTPELYPAELHICSKYHTTSYKSTHSPSLSPEIDLDNTEQNPYITHGIIPTHRSIPTEHSKQFIMKLYYLATTMLVACASARPLIPFVDGGCSPGIPNIIKTPLASS
jgi:hypothetical protein